MLVQDADDPSGEDTHNEAQSLKTALTSFRFLGGGFGGPVEVPDVQKQQSDAQSSSSVDDVPMKQNNDDDEEEDEDEPAPNAFRNLKVASDSGYRKLSNGSQTITTAGSMGKKGSTGHVKRVGSNGLPSRSKRNTSGSAPSLLHNGQATNRHARPEIVIDKGDEDSGDEDEAISKFRNLKATSDSGMRKKNGNELGDPNEGGPRSPGAVSPSTSDIGGGGGGGTLGDGDQKARIGHRKSLLFRGNNNGEPVTLGGAAGSNTASYLGVPSQGLNSSQRSVDGESSDDSDNNHNHNTHNGGGGHHNPKPTTAVTLAPNPLEALENWTPEAMLKRAQQITMRTYDTTRVVLDVVALITCAYFWIVSLDTFVGAVDIPAPVGVYVVDVLLSFTMIFDMVRRYTILKKKGERGRFQHYFMFVVGDVVPCIPLDLIATQALPDSVTFIIISRCLRLPKIIRCWNLIQNDTRHLIIMSKYHLTLWTHVGASIMFTFRVIVAMHMLTIIRMGIAINNRDYLTSLYYVAYTITTIGYGDVPVEGTGEKVYAMILCALGATVCGVLYGVLTMYVQQGNLHSERRGVMRSTLSIMTFLKVPASLVTQMLSYQNHVVHHTLGTGHAEVIRQLPQCIQDRIEVYMTLKLVRQVPLFKKAGEQSCLMVAAELQSVSFSASDVITRCGDKALTMYFVAYGVVEMYSIEGKACGVLRTGSFFGETEMMNDESYEQSAVALTFCDLFTLSREQFSALLQASEELTHCLESEMLKRDNGNKDKAHQLTAKAKKGVKFDAEPPSVSAAPHAMPSRHVLITPPEAIATSPRASGARLRGRLNTSTSSVLHKEGSGGNNTTSSSLVDRLHLTLTSQSFGHGNVPAPLAQSSTLVQSGSGDAATIQQLSSAISKLKQELSSLRMQHRMSIDTSSRGGGDGSRGRQDSMQAGGLGVSIVPVESMYMGAGGGDDMAPPISGVALRLPDFLKDSTKAVE